MRDRTGALPIRLLAYALWLAITLYGPLLLPAPPGAGAGLFGTLADGIGWHFLFAALFAVLALWRLAPAGIAGLSPPRPVGRWSFLATPMLLPPAMIGAALVIAPVDRAVLPALLVNTALIALSEELMFRGLLLSALAARLGPARGILWSSLLFAAVHLANLPVTGSVAVTLAQAVAAGMSGVFFAAIVRHTGSLLPAILYHWLWNVATLLLSAAIAAGGPAGAAVPGLLVPLLLVFPNFAYALSALARQGAPVGSGRPEIDRT